MASSISFLIPQQYLGATYTHGGTDRYPRVRLVPENPALPTAWLPIAPNALPNDGLAATYTRVDSPGRTPVMLRSSEPLHTITLTPTLVQRPTMDEDVETQLARLRVLARSTSRVRLSYGASEGGWWWITAFGWDVEERVPYRNDILRASARIELTRATGGAAIDEYRHSPMRAVLFYPPGQGGAPASTIDEPRRRTYTVKRGDTLARIAQRLLGNADLAGWLADTNAIRDPRRVKVGTVLVIPWR